MPKTVKEMKPNKNLGKRVRDILTGFEGTATGFCQYMTGCDQYLVLPECEKGKVDKYPEAKWIDVNRLEEVKVVKGEKVVQKAIDTKTAKGPCGNAPTSY